MKIDIEYLKKNKLIIFEGISGSRAYGLDTPQSDTDIKGVFILPENLFFGFDYIGQVNNETNDIVYYELKKFFSLLTTNNPNVLEMLNLPEDCILYKDEFYSRIKLSDFLSQLCRETFAGYALTQVKKARGLNKKIMNPLSKEKKGILDFCYVTYGFRSIACKKWLMLKGYKQEYCGLSKLNHFKDSYALFYSVSDQGFYGIVKKENSNDVCVSSIPEEMEPETYLYFNRDGYTRYIKDYREYWNWVEHRNEERYQSTINHGQNYDAKNMMHTFRLLAMAEEIAREGNLKVRREDREKLLAIKKGMYLYNELIERANKRIEVVEELFNKSILPLTPDYTKIEQLLITIRKEFYARTNDK